MRDEGQTVAIAKLCRWFGVPRSTFYYRRPPAPGPQVVVVDRVVEQTIRTIIDAEPTVGVRMITARVRRTSQTPVNKKKIHRIVKLNQWQVQRRESVPLRDWTGYRPESGWRTRWRRSFSGGRRAAKSSCCCS